MSEHRREDEAEKMLLMFTTPYATCGGMRLLEFAAKFGEHEALGVLCRQYGWDATKLPSPASPAVGGEEEAAFRESVRRQIVQQFTKDGKSPALIASMDLFTTRLFDSICQRLVAPLRAEIAALKQEVAGGSWAYVKQIDDLRTTLEAVKKERDELREQVKAEPTRKTFFAMKNERDAMADGLAKIAKMAHEWNCKARCMGRGGMITQINNCNCHVGVARALLASREEKKE